MIYHSDKALFVKIAERLCDDILADRYREGDRVPSVRELAAEYEVNTNTAVKTYEHLAREGVIYTKRGLGYFVAPDAREQILQSRREAFRKQTLPELFRQMKLLGIGIEEIQRAWQSEG